MITAVDTSVLLDLFTADATFGARSADALRACLAEGGLVACDVVWAETSACFPDEHSAETALEQLRVDFSPMGAASSSACGAAWRDYRRNGGSRDRVMADFLIGAHAMKHADRLLTRDRGFYRKCFSGLVILDPSTA